MQCINKTPWKFIIERLEQGKGCKDISSVAVISCHEDYPNRSCPKMRDTYKQRSCYIMSWVFHAFSSKRVKRNCPLLNILGFKYDAFRKIQRYRYCKTRSCHGFISYLQDSVIVQNHWYLITYYSWMSYYRSIYYAYIVGASGHSADHFPLIDGVAVLHKW
jgi:hypothetical protein